MLLADYLAVGLRALAIAATLQAAGLAVFRAAFGTRAGASDLRMAGHARWIASGALVLVVASQLFEPARLMGSLSGVFDASLHALLLSSDLGAVFSMRLLGLLCVAIGCMRATDRQFGVLASAIGATFIAVSFSLMGHTAAHELRWALSLLLALHVLVLAFWFGGLGGFLIVARHEPVAINARVIGAFSSVAGWLVPGSMLAGVAMAAILLPGWASLGTPYGLSLLAKLAGFVVLLGLASLNKWRFGPAIAAGRKGALQAFQCIVFVEWGLIAVVIAITTVMTSLFSPD